PINLGFSFNFYGTIYNQVWINNNGNITFGGAFGTFSPTGFPSNTPMIAGFWADVDTRNAASTTVKYKISPGKLIVSWAGVGYYNTKGDKLNWFQIIITDGADASIGLGNNVALNYGDMQWTTGDASGGSNGFGGTAATVGINKGDNTNFVQVGRFGLNNSAYDGGGGATDGVNYLDYECFRFNVSSITNQAPSVSGVPAGNTVTVTCGSTANIALTFLPPEINQTVTTTINTGSLCNTTTNITNGNTSTAIVNITAAPCNLGTNTITFTATDNFNPAASTIVNITINVVADTTTIISNSPLCVGNTLNLSATNAGSGATYSWTGPNNFTSTSSAPTISNIQTNQAGTYNLTLTRPNGCVSTATSSVAVNTLPVVNLITGNNIVPVGVSSTLSNTTSGGVWTSSNPSVATINSS
ncbi:MAG: nidogen-like domain-containing protein, partial [Dolichospermum sp.]